MSTELEEYQRLSDALTRAIAASEPDRLAEAQLRFLFGKGPQPQQKETRMASNPAVSKQAATISGTSPTSGRPQGMLGRPGGAMKPGQPGKAKSNVQGTKKR